MSSGLQVKYQLYLSDFNETCYFLTNFRKMLKYEISRPVGAEVFHMDGRTDGRTGMTKLIVAFRKFANAPKIIPSAHRLYLSDLYMSQNKRRPLPYTESTDWLP